MRPAPLVAVRTVVCALLVSLLGGSALPAAASPPAEPKPGKKLCSISEDALAEISGLVTTKDGYVAVADGAADGGQLLQVFELDDKCEVTERHSFQQDPYDPEDMAIASDGTLWVADIGDNKLERDTVALWKISPDRSSAVIHRLTYPDGKHDAEALLMPRDGKPIIITKDLDGGGVAGIYVATAALKPDQSVPMKKAGELTFKATGVPGGPVGAVGQRLVTGAAMSTDGKRAAVRTYTDAYEWRVSGNDVAKALTKGKPTRTPLPGEAQGEAITFSRDGDRFITGSEAPTAGDAPQLYSYVPAKPAPPKKPAARPGSQLSWFDNLSLQDIKIIIAAVGVLGVILLVLGIWGIRRHRKANPPDPDDDRYAGPDDHGGPGGRNAPRDPRNVPGRDPRDRRVPRDGAGQGGRAAGRASVGPPPPGPAGVGRARPTQVMPPGPRDLPPRPGRSPSPGSGRVPPPGSGRVPPPSSGRVPPPTPGRVPPPASGRVPPSGAGRVPPPSDPGGGAAPRPVRNRPDDPHFGQQPPTGEYW